jgi:hypothetical protein
LQSLRDDPLMTRCPSQVPKRRDPTRDPRLALGGGTWLAKYRRTQLAWVRRGCAGVSSDPGMFNTTYLTQIFREYRKIPYCVAYFCCYSQCTIRNSLSGLGVADAVALVACSWFHVGSTPPPRMVVSLMPLAKALVAPILSRWQHGRNTISSH